MVRRLDDYFVRADAIHAIEESFPFAVQSAFDAQRRKLVGDHADRPSRSVFAAAVTTVGENFLRRFAFIARAEGTNGRVAFYVHTLPNEIHGALAAIGGNDDPTSGNGILAKLRQTVLLVVVPEYSTTAVISRRDANSFAAREPTRS